MLPSQGSAACCLLLCACAADAGTESRRESSDSPAPPSSAAPQRAPPARTVLLTIDSQRRLECAEERCKGEVHHSGRIDFDHIDPETRVIFGSRAERRVHDRGLGKKPRFQLDGPDLGQAFQSQPLEKLISPQMDDQTAVVLPLTLRFPDGASAEAAVPFSRTALTLAFIERMNNVTKGPVGFPSDDPHTGKPRAMWVQFPLGVLGTASSIAELDWVLVLDEPSRKIECERHGGPLGHKAGASNEKATFDISDVRARVYERRTGRLVGEKTMPASDAPSCGQLFNWRDNDVGGVIGRRSIVAPKALADWAWTTLR